MVLTVSFVLLCPGSFATVASRISGASQPGWAVAPPQDLTPASGRQDHTTSPYASASFVSPPFDRSRAFRQPALHHVARLTLPRPPHPHPASVTIAIRPCSGVGRLESIKLFLPNCEAEYFCWRYWTGFSSARPSRL